jgi:hypothetical protein
MKLGRKVPISKSQEHKMVWKTTNQPCQKIDNDTTLVLETFGDANRMGVKNISKGVDRLTQ